MEKEIFLSGYCRMLDGSRTVELILADGGVKEVDCQYFSCLCRTTCPLAKKIEEAVKA